MKSIHFQIVTPERVVFNAPEVESISLPTKMGELTILPDHLPLVASLMPGEVRVKIGGQEINLAVSGGFIEVAPGRVVVLADTAERAEEIDEQRAEEARVKARQFMLQEHVTEETDYAGLAAKLAKELARLKVVRRHRERKPLAPRIEE